MLEHERVNDVMPKNARNHSLYELDRSMNWQPDCAMILPIESRTREYFDKFEGVTGGLTLSGWPEIGTRMFSRFCYFFGPEDSDIVVVVQDHACRFWVEDFGGGCWSDP
ncbi:MAG: hypothetical protein OXC41_02245 [Gammaproteobacteria bacterium]|nr:hypothetical protein [Gammaproteobacteria bacterium]